MGGLIDVREQDHLHRFHHRPTKHRDNDSHHLPVAVTSSRDHREGFRRFGRRERGSDLPVEDLFSAEPQRNSPKKAGGRLIRVLLEEEKSRETEIRHQSPSVIARLMGLDTIPIPQVTHKQRKATPMGYRKASPRRFQESGDFVDLSLQASTSEEEKFKDVFEVMESSEMEKHKKQPVWNHMPKKSEKEFNPGRKKFMDSARLPIGDSPQNCEELDDYLESLDSGEEHFPKFLQKPNSLPSKHLDDLKPCAPPSAEPSLITILRSSKHRKGGERGEVFGPERKTERYSHLPKDITSSRRRPKSNNDGHSLKESDPYAHESKVKNTDIEDSCLSPTQIVVLKPSPERAERVSRNTSLPEPSKFYQFDFRRNQEFQLSGMQELRSEGKEGRKYYEDSQVMNNKAKSSRELAREITEQIRLRHIREETSRVMSNNNSKLSEHTSNNLDHRSKNYHTSTSCSSESSVSKEARKRLSERWNMTHRFREESNSGGGSGTLGEMLAQSDTENPRHSYTFVLNKDSAEKSARHDKLATHRRHSAELPRSTSLPLPTVSGNPKPRSRIEDSGSDSGDNCDMLKEMLNFEPNDSLHGYSVRRRLSGRRFKYGSDKPRPSQAIGEENIHPVREIHVIQPSSVSEESKSKLSAMADRMNENVRYLSDNSLSSESLSVILGCISPEVQAQQEPMDDESSANDHTEISIKETSHVQPQEDIFSSPCDRKDSESPVIFHVAEQPSPISVLEPETEEESYSSQCFEKISADLQSIRMQLQLLKLESEDNADDPQTISDDETGRDSVTSGANHQAFTNEEDRDFSYILDVLVSSGIHGINKDMLFSACYSPSHPVDQAVFEKLENKYGALVAWSESDRKLLFDHVNSILAEMFAPCMDLHPWASSERKLGPAFPPQGLAEEVSRIVYKQRKALCIGNPEDKVLDTKWIETGDYVDTIGRDIERMLKEELLDELVLELIAENVSYV